MSVVTRVQRYEYSNGAGPYLGLNGGEKPDDAPRRSMYVSENTEEGITRQPIEVQDEYYSEWQPQPDGDDMGPYWAEPRWEGQKFGFANTHERRSWFSSYSHKRLRRLGVELVEYTLLLESVDQLTLGGHQLAFDPNTVIERKVLK